MVLKQEEGRNELSHSQYDKPGLANEMPGLRSRSDMYKTDFLQVVHLIL